MPKLLLVPEVARSLQLHPATVVKMLKSGRLPGIRVGCGWRIDQDKFNEWLASGGDRGGQGSSAKDQA